MRLRTFTARTTMEAMALVRAHLGPDAVIISTQEDGSGGARVTAALDDDTEPPAPDPAREFDEIIGDALAFHGIAPEARAAILKTIAPLATQGALAALSGALATLYRFESMKQKSARVTMLVGPQGSGKTATAAKLATRAVLAGQRIRLVTTDMARAGGVAQLEAFAKILQAPFQAVDGPGRLAAALSASDPAESVIVDTGGANPFNAGDRSEIAALVTACEAEPILVAAAGGDASDSVAMAEFFRELGCERVIIARLDATRRLGSVLAVAHASRVGLAEAGIAPDIADGLVPFTPLLLARLLLSKGAS